MNEFDGRDPARWRTHLARFGEVTYHDLYPGIDVAYYGRDGRFEYDLVVRPGADATAATFRVAGIDRETVGSAGDLVLQLQQRSVSLEAPVAYQTVGDRRQPVPAAYRLAADGRVGFALGPYDPTLPLTIDPGLVASTYLGGTGSDSPTTVALDSAGNVYVAGFTASTDFPTTSGAFQISCGDCTTGFGAFVAKLDPTLGTLVYSTYLSGSGQDRVYGLAVDGAGDAYVAGFTDSADFPVTPGAFQTSCGGGSAGCLNDDAFVTKLDPTGGGLLYSTYLGGSAQDDAAALALDGAGDAYVAGTTYSTDFPVTAGAFRSSCGGDAFVTKLNPAGSALVYSTCLGGSGDEYEAGLALDSAGDAYVTGTTFSPDFPTTRGAVQRVCSGSLYRSAFACKTYGDGFVTKLDASGSALVYSTYLGGRYGDVPNALAVDGAGNAYVTGYTYSNDFPVTAGAFQTTAAGCSSASPQPCEAFVTKLNAAGTAFAYSTYLGGTSYDEATAIAVDGAGDAYVAGTTQSADFPTTADAFRTTFGGLADGFATKLDAGGGALLYSTYVGGSSADSAAALAADGAGDVYVAGSTGSVDFPVTAGAFQPACAYCSPTPSYSSAYDGYLTELGTS